MNEYTFFWKVHEPFGFLSQWYPSQFSVDGIMYHSCEQYMMAKKALLFEDIKYYFAIMEAKTPEECKKLGKHIRNFDEEKWNTCKEEIVYHANLAKFSQNEELKKQLMQTGDTILAEASPFDPVWGIGMHASNNLEQEKWPGQNLLGKILMKVRKELRKERYVSELFALEPYRWGAKGDSYFWKWLREKYCTVLMPYDVERLESEIREDFKRFTGRDLDDGGSYYVKAFDHGGSYYVKAFDHGGMSSGYITAGFWLKAIEVLKMRCEKCQ